MMNDVIDTIVPDFSQEKDVKTFKYDSQMYVDGQSCANGNIRSADVLYSCGRESHIESVTEIDVCNYVLKVSTPIACSKELEKQAYDHVAKLGVFGSDNSKLLGGISDNSLAKAWQATDNGESESFPAEVEVSEDIRTEGGNIQQTTVSSSPDVFGNEELIEL